MYDEYEYTLTEMAVDFAINFTGTKWSYNDIVKHYGCNKWRATRLKQRLEILLDIEPAGFRGKEYLWFFDTAKMKEK